MPAWSVKTRHAPSRHFRDARFYGHTAWPGMTMGTPPPPPPLSVQTVLRLESDALSMVKWLRHATDEYPGFDPTTPAPRPNPPLGLCEQLRSESIGCVEEEEWKRKRWTEFRCEF